MGRFSRGGPLPWYPLDSLVGCDSCSWRGCADIDASCWMNAVKALLVDQRALEDHWRAITQGRMAAAWIIKSFDVFKHGELGFSLRLKRTPIEQFTFQRREKRFRHRV